MQSRWCPICGISHCWYVPSCWVRVDPWMIGIQPASWLITCVKHHGTVLVWRQRRIVTTAASTQDRRQTQRFHVWTLQRGQNQRGEHSFGSADEWNVKPNLIHLAKRLGTKAFALQPWTWPSSIKRGCIRDGKQKKTWINDRIKDGNKSVVFFFFCS